MLGDKLTVELFVALWVIETTENLSGQQSGRNRLLLVGGGLRGGGVGGRDEGIKDGCVRKEDDKVCLVLARKHTDTHRRTHTQDAHLGAHTHRGCNSLFNYM